MEPNMKNRIKPHLLMIFLCVSIPMLLSSLLFAQDNRPKRILVLHSYHRGLSWDDAIDRGIESVFRESGLNIETQIEYMDSKRIHDATYMRQLYTIYRHKFKNLKFDVIISVDNNALNFLLKHRDELFPGTPAVFCGVNNFKDSMLKGQSLYTGVVEAIEVGGTIDIALKLHPKIRQIIIYGTDTQTYFANKEVVKKVMPLYEGSVDFHFIEGLNIKEVQDNVQKLPDDSIVLLIASMKDEKGNRILFKRFAEMVDIVSHVPQYSLWDFILGYGIFGGKVISGVAQGEAAARMAFRILHGEKVANIPVLKESPNRFMFDYNQMTRFGLNPSDLPQGSFLVNRPYSFYSRHKAAFWAVIIIISSLLAFIMALGITIARRRRAEVALRKSETRYRALFEQSRDAIAITKQDGQLIDINRSFLELLGYEREELMRMKVEDIWADPASRSRWQEEMKKKGSLADYSWKVRRKDGEERDCVLTSTERLTGEGTVQYQSIVRDITEQKKAEEELRQSEERYRMLVEESFDGVFIQKGARIVFANQRLHEMLGYANGELAGTDHWLVYHPEYQEMTRERAKARMRGERVTSQYEVKLVRKDGSWFYGEVGARVIHLEGKPGIQVWVRDIMKRRLVEEKIQQSEKRFRDLFNSITDLIYTQDLEGRFLSINPAMTKTFGYEQEEFIGRKAVDFMKPEFRPLFESEYLGQLKTKGYYEGIAAYFTIDGRKIYIEYHSTLVKPEEGEPCISGTGRDVTERVLAERQIKKLQEQVLQAKKMEAIGVLAGGIAHDFNNLLMGIQGNASLMLLDTNSRHPHHERLKNIEQYVRQGADLTKQLLGFARGGRYEVRPTDLNELITHQNRLFGRTKKEIRIGGKYEKDLWTVEVDQGQMEQVLLNLYINAWQATPGGGDLYVQTENVELDEVYVKSFDLTAGRYVKISITDTGIGMDDATRQKIFDPFFTTKEMGRGTGLGLASVYGIINNHDGIITVYSERGEGTTFNIYLPATASEVGSQKSEASEDVRHGDETILLVDDEEMIIEVGEEMLHALGYKVLIARGGKEAIEIYRENSDQIDIVLLDMIMPDMEGGASYDRLKEINPHIKVLLSSGYSINGQAQDILGRGCDGFIQKPFNMKDLSRKLREILDF